jgi:hypothetical protein
LLVTLARQGAIRDVIASVHAPDGVPSAGRAANHRWGLNVRRSEQDFSPVADSVERENFRAQSAAAMHREPANRVARWHHPVWRLSAETREHVGAGASGFELELHIASRLLGSAFLVLLSATAAFLLWCVLTRAAVPRATVPSAAPTTQPTGVPRAEVAGPPAATPPAGADLSAFSGRLRSGVDPSLEVGDRQGVLELIGPSDIDVEVNGVERGSLPLAVVLDEGRHAVRYRFGPRTTYRFYYIRAGTTRSVRAVAQPGGLVDAR